MLTSFEKFNTQNRKQGKTRKSDERKKNFLSSRLLEKHTQHQLGLRSLSFLKVARRRKWHQGAYTRQDFSYSMMLSGFNNSLQPFHEESWWFFSSRCQFLTKSTIYKCLQCTPTTKLNNLRKAKWFYSIANNKPPCIGFRRYYFHKKPLRSFLLYHYSPVKVDCGLFSGKYTSMNKILLLKQYLRHDV